MKTKIHYDMGFDKEIKTYKHYRHNTTTMSTDSINTFTNSYIKYFSKAYFNI